MQTTLQLCLSSINAETETQSLVKQTLAEATQIISNLDQTLTLDLTNQTYALKIGNESIPLKNGTVLQSAQFIVTVKINVVPTESSAITSAAVVQSDAVTYPIATAPNVLTVSAGVQKNFLPTMKAEQSCQSPVVNSYSPATRLLPATGNILQELGIK